MHPCIKALRVVRLFKLFRQFQGSITLAVAIEVGAEEVQAQPWRLKVTCFQPLNPESAYSAFNLNLVLLSFAGALHAGPRA